MVADDHLAAGTAPGGRPPGGPPLPPAPPGAAGARHPRPHRPPLRGRRRGPADATVADPLLADLLGVRTGDPLLVLRSVSFDQHGEPMEVFSAYHRGDRSRFEFHLRAPGADPAASAAEALTVQVPSIQPVPSAGAPAVLHGGVRHSY